MNKIKHFLRPAAIISALPNTIANGVAVDATPVMADFNHIVNQVNANAADVSLVALLAATNSFTQPQSGVAATAAANFPIVTQVQNSVFLTLTSTLGTNTITARCAALALGALANGQIFTFVPSQTNTGAVTLNPDGVGATTVFMGGTNVTSGQLIKDIPVAVRYESPILHVISVDNARGSVVDSSVTAQTVAVATISNVTSISLTAGDWDVSGVIDTSAITSQTGIRVGISQTSATLSGTYGKDKVEIPANTSGGFCAGGIPRLRVVLSATTTIYLVAQSQVADITSGVSGYLCARRII